MRPTTAAVPPESPARPHESPARPDPAAEKRESRALLAWMANEPAQMILLEGRHDRTVNSDVAHDWFTRVTAPQKTFVWFEHSAHEPESEEPGKFLLSLVRYARPIAQKAGDAAP